jgi:catechol 2,3-dioxygenase-like lactoylglutathione lyase family enzyme
MESVINGLLKQFEDGKMTRRQLIQSLALAAVAAAPAGTAAAQTAATIPAATSPAPWKTVWLDHISYAVSDYRRSTAFYRDLMGWTIKNDNGTNQCTLEIAPNIGEIIIRNNRQAGAGAATASPAAAAPAAAAAPSAAGGGQGRGDRPPLTGVINHVSWGIEPWDTEGVKAELTKRGLNPRPDMVGDKFKSYHVLDPDGWDLQISNVNSKNRG